MQQRNVRDCGFITLIKQLKQHQVTAFTFGSNKCTKRIKRSIGKRIEVPEYRLEKI